MFQRNYHWKVAFTDEIARRMVRVPDKDMEDARHINRELKSLKIERTSHTNRIKGLLVANGCPDVSIDHDFSQWLEQAVGGWVGGWVGRWVGRWVDRWVGDLSKGCSGNSSVSSLSLTTSGNSRNISMR